MRDKVISRYTAGESGIAIAEDFGVSKWVVYRWLEESGVPRRNPREAMLAAVANGRQGGPRKQNAKRERRIIRLSERGKSYSEIAAKVGISREAVAGAIWRWRRRTQAVEAA